MILTKNTLQEIYRTNLNQIHILHEYKLREVTAEEALRLRHSGKAGLIIKQNSHLLYFKILKKDFSIFSTRTNIFEGNHLCSYGRTCKHFLKCPKIMEPLPRISNQNSKSIKILSNSARIEKYDFINFGIETFNLPESSNEYFAVLKCENYEEEPKK